MKTVWPYNENVGCHLLSLTEMLPFMLWCLSSSCLVQGKATSLLGLNLSFTSSLEAVVDKEDRQTASADVGDPSAVGL